MVYKPSNLLDIDNQSSNSNLTVPDGARRLELLYNSIQIFLTNFENMPSDASTIHWPNRKRHIEEFREHIKKIAGKDCNGK